jgi:hypothetical protein
VCVCCVFGGLCVWAEWVVCWFFFLQRKPAYGLAGVDWV